MKLWVPYAYYFLKHVFSNICINNVFLNVAHIPTENILIPMLIFPYTNAKFWLFITVGQEVHEENLGGGHRAFSALFLQLFCKPNIISE